MVVNGPKAPVVETATITALQATWFQRIEHLHEAANGSAGLECASQCTARCCPQSIARRDPAYAVGHVAIMLPFEMEYILSRTDVAPTQLQHAPLELAPGITIDIGFVTRSTPCPFLTTNYQCGIHDIRPLDCRSFPLIPVFSSNGTMTFRLDAECPSIREFSAAYQVQLRGVWEDLLSKLPINYRMLYFRL